MKKIALYARVSTEEQKNNYSIGEQIEQLSEYCNRQGWEVKEKYIDAGYSGANMDRPALKKMLLELKNYDAIVVWKLDRLSRSIIDTMTIIERDLLEQGTHFVALAENINTTSSTWITQAGIYSTIAQSEREAIKERMQMGKLARVRSGKPMSWTNAPFGYTYNSEKETLDIVPLEADIVLQIFNEYEYIGSVTKLRNMLNDEGHVGKNVPWSYRTVKAVLENPVYKGYNRYKDEEYKGNHQSIITEELFDKVQILMEKRRVQASKTLNPRPFQTKYMLSGQITCGYCGAPLQIVQYKRVKGVTYKYNCRNRNKPMANPVYNNGKKCTESGIYFKNDLEDFVINEISKLQLDEKLVYEYSKDTNKKLSELEDYNKELETNKKNAKKIISLYMAELIDDAEMKERSKNLKSEESYLKGKIRDLKNENNEALDFLQEEKVNIKDMEYEEQKRTVEIIIDKIQVKNDEMTINWKF